MRPRGDASKYANKVIYISAITPVALFSLLIGTEDRRRLPAGREGRPKRPNINLLPIIFLSFLPTGKIADNQIK
jgi:hypothetical protein